MSIPLLLLNTGKKSAMATLTTGFTDQLAVIQSLATSIKAIAERQDTGLSGQDRVGGPNTPLPDMDINLLRDPAERSTSHPVQAGPEFKNYVHSAQPSNLFESPPRTHMTTHVRSEPMDAGSTAKKRRLKEQLVNEFELKRVKERNELLEYHNVVNKVVDDAFDPNL